jgi:hypothetical protein
MSFKEFFNDKKAATANFTTFRQRYRITPDEEDAIVAKVEETFRGMFELRVHDNIVKLVNDGLNKAMIPGDTLEFTYSHSTNPELLIGMLGTIREKQAKKATPLIKSKYRKK